MIWSSELYPTKYSVISSNNHGSPLSNTKQWSNATETSNFLRFTRASAEIMSSTYRLPKTTHLYHICQIQHEWGTLSILCRQTWSKPIRKPIRVTMTSQGRVSLMYMLTSNRARYLITLRVSRCRNEQWVRLDSDHANLFRVVMINFDD